MDFIERNSMESAHLFHVFVSSPASIALLLRENHERLFGPTMTLIIIFNGVNLGGSLLSPIRGSALNKASS